MGRLNEGGGLMAAVTNTMLLFDPCFAQLLSCPVKTDALHAVVPRRFLQDFNCPVIGCRDGSHSRVGAF